MKLKYKVTLGLLLLIVVPFLAVGWYSAYKASDLMKEEVGRTTLQLVKQNHTTLTKTLSAVNDRTITLLDNHFFSDAKQYSFWTGIESLGEINEADAILERWSSDGTEYTIYMRNLAGKRTPFDLSHKTKGFKYLDAQNGNLPEGAADVLSAGGSGVLRLMETKSGGTSVTYMRSILNPKTYSESIGLLVVSKLEVLLTRDLVSVELPAGADIYLLGDDGKLLMREGQDNPSLTVLPERAGAGGEGYFFAKEGTGSWLYAYSSQPESGTRLVYRIPLSSIVGEQTRFQTSILIISALYLGFVLLFVLYLTRLIVRPLIRLVSITKIYEPGKPLEIHPGLLRQDEFGILYGAFVRMTKRLDTTIEENYGMAIKHKENELSALHSQITPHLLYNTLDSIYWYALDSGNQDVGEMVKDLSKLLRIGLSKGRTIITIAEELEHAQAYGRLQMKRYPDAFELMWEVDESLLSCRMPKVIIQPLLENAIFHAVSGMDGEGAVWIHIGRFESVIRIMVEDNGYLPVDTAKLADILSGLAGDKGYGIRNVHQRIQLHYGDIYGLRYEQREGGGLRAIIELPAENSSENV